MSRAPPFPTRRSPSIDRNSISSPIPTPSTATRPLQISRPTAGNSPYPSPSPRLAPSNPSSSGPARPQRSELRSRAPGHDSSEQASYRDSLSTIQSDASLASRSRLGAISSNVVAKSKPRPQPLQSPVSDEEYLSTPTSLASALSAFKSAGSRRRDMVNESDDLEYQAERQNAIEEEKARQQRIRDKVPGRRTNGKARVGDIDAVLDQIQDGWEFIIDPDASSFPHLLSRILMHILQFNNVDLALQLLDDSSHGKDMDSFRRTKNMLGQALKGSVDKHYQAFAASLPHRAALLGHLGETQTQIQGSRTSLLETKEALGNKRADLVQLWARGQTLDEMLRLLDQIEHLKAVPDLLETLMSEKRLLQAAVLLVRSLKTINKPDMFEIGAVSDLRSYLVGQETALRDILVDELQNHLYLKSFWCDTRWAAYTPNQQDFPKIEFEEEGPFKLFDTQESTSNSLPFRPSRHARFLSGLAIKPNEPPIDLSDLGVGNSQPLSSNIASASSTNNPEADSFAYMETLLESLAVLGKLGSALDNVAQRLPSEIFNLVETTLDEVEERAEYGRRTTVLGLSEILGSTEESSSKRVEHEILKDLFWTLYSKLDAVAQGLRVIYEVANRIGSRRAFKDSSGAKPGSLFPLAEIWTPVQTEVRTLIYDYLTDEDQGSVSGRNPISSINEILQDGKFIRDRGKAVFRFADTDSKITTKTLRPYEDDLTRVLNDTMPGLVSGSGDAVQATLANVGTDDRILGADQHHRLIIRPDVFHVSVLFQPTLAFLSRISMVLPFGVGSERASSAVLDEFVLRVYLPQLEEKVSELFHQAVTGPDAFQPDPSATLLCPEPLVKHTTHGVDQFPLCYACYQSISSRKLLPFQDLVTLRDISGSKLEPNLAFAAQWAQRLEVSTCMSELLSIISEKDGVKLFQLCRQETSLETQLLSQKALTEADLIPSVGNLASLAALYRSVSWFTSELDALKSRPDDTLSPMSPQNLEPLSGATPYTPFIPIISAPDHLKLPLSREMSLRFQALLKTYEQLSSLILDTIRIDVRCRTIYYLESSMRQGNYSIDGETMEPDPRIGELNTELVKCDDLVSTCLPARERQFVFAGLGYLMEDLVISNARHLRCVTPFGIKKILRNMLALHYAKDMLDNIRKKALFTFEDYQTMLNLQCGVNQNDGEAGAAKATDRNYSMYMIELHGLELEGSGS
ncbi:putative exocyst complex component sec8 [Termitomyces sp. J132]|nr:putative exocyst complex component sec8 [Termitomyces sp. J132]